MPASELAAARAEIAKLQRRVPSKKTLENEILKEAVEYAAEKVDCALALVARGRPMKTVCRALSVAHSHVHERHHRSEDWSDGRKGRTPTGDAQWLAEIRQQITDLPSYGYRRACALVNRQRSAQAGKQDGARVDPKRAYRVIAQAGLLLPKAPLRRQSSRRHEGQVAVVRSDLRWCSD